MSDSPDFRQVKDAPVVDALLKRSLVKSCVLPPLALRCRLLPRADASGLSIPLGRFFEHFAEPLSSVFHKPTFFAALYEERTSPLLLNAIFAWSARFSSHPSLVAISPERRLRGEAFADQVRAAVDRPEWVDEALHGSDAVDPDEEIERAQALLLLTAYESLLRRGTKTLKCLGACLPFPRPAVHVRDFRR